MIPMTPEEAHEAGRRDPCILQPGERIAHFYKERPVLVGIDYAAGQNRPSETWTKSAIDGKVIITVEGWSVDD